MGMFPGQQSMLNCDCGRAGRLSIVVQAVVCDDCEEAVIYPARKGSRPTVGNQVEVRARLESADGCLSVWKGSDGPTR